MVDFNELELSRDRTIAAILAHATLWYALTASVTVAYARTVVDAEYLHWIDQVRTDRGLHLPQ